MNLARVLEYKFIGKNQFQFYTLATNIWQMKFLKLDYKIAFRKDKVI